ARYSLVRLDELERIAAGLQPVAHDFGLVAHLAGDAHEATRIEMAFAEISPKLVPRLIGFRYQPAVSRRRTIGAADDAVMVARGSKRIGYLSLFKQGHVMTGSGQRPRGREAGNSRADNDDLHPRCSLFGMPPPC